MARQISSASFYLLAAGTALAGLFLAALGAQLAWAGGSAFYALSGALLLLAGLQLARRRLSAIHLTALNFAATWAWAIHEVGLDGWALLPRVDFISVLLPLFLLPFVRSRLAPEPSGSQLAGIRRGYAIGAQAVLGGVALLVALRPGWAEGSGPGPAIAPRSAGAPVAAGWAYPGQDPGGARFSDLYQIDRGNVGKLQRVWTYREPVPQADTPGLAFKDEAVPLQVDGKLFACTGNDTVIALDAETGRLLWRHDPRVRLQGVLSGICRGVAYHDGTTAAGAPSSSCAKRIMLATLDARLIALDAGTGRPCPDFGQGGEVSLRQGIEPIVPGQYYQTSPPAIVNGLAVIGGLVQDNQSTGEPSGVIRAFDVRTGALAWAWDLGRPGDASAAPVPAPYTRGTPNSWTLLSADPDLGLVYVPTGNATPDFVGSHRKPLWEKFASSIVALDVKTGRVRWSYQFVHHDLWDYDTSAQPVLFDMPTQSGPVPALLQATKHGQLFVLDRRTGQPLTGVIEKPVPQTDVPGEWTARTQPFSVGMPSVDGPALNERSMWGISPFDQLLCRRKFHALRYDGVFTPPSLRGSIFYPSQLGGVDWGGVSVDKGRGLLIVPSTRFATVTRLEPRSDGADYAYPQAGTPYGVVGGPFMTALGVPCQSPPYSTLTAIDLRSRKVVWERPLGTAEEIGPLGVASHLPFTIGAPPVVGGPITTAGDLVFIGAVGDRRLRAIDSLTGKELWSDKLPAGNQATPITYRAPRSGRQMVVIVSGGRASLFGAGNMPFHVVAYALR
ncbi:membrane-bound PQQ-dependent dehydrogenase, glucose/quinate/shikimate family [Novosphingobium flavum]|uniref:Membrane-bound PQQ-dependent dehydrogenase, glucose/quinate/shikimate family n=1 Tax=Novosphingobium flavum TaxID=1778672 RepID=A0A7X1FQL0_9SPHN|nr:membrane-bound PQQ-dependent dehydrogenase, glucose/quinate/shikimate family [Novosphingobium flavum]MBC2665155.1 membrane-bound PQQ-dependent dehydrogenase, glucose/quinate/shikimate family [Novosphingobium flavum]